MTTVVAFRLANWDTPLWISPNRRLGRYAPEGGIVQFWSLHPLTPWAEYLRAQGISDPAEVKELLVRPWVGEIDLPSDTVEITFDNAADLGIAPNALIDDNHSACREWVLATSPSALVVPSAALPGTQNLVLFAPRVRVRYGVTPLDPTVDIPCDPVADLSIPVIDLLAHIRWRGTPHAGYEAWLNGDAQPLPPSVVTV